MGGKAFLSSLLVKIMDKEFKATLFKFIFYNIIGMVCISLYILVDTYFISVRLGSIGLVASNLALPIYTLNNSLGLMFGIGYGNRYNNLKSLDKEKDSIETLIEALMVGFAVGLIFTFIGIFFTDKLAEMLGTDTDTHALTCAYLRLILLYSPAFIINNIAIVFCKNDNDPKTAMIAMIVSSIANGCMDYVLMFIFDMGMFGAAIATCFSAIISAFIVLYFHFYKKYKSSLFEKFELKRIKTECIRDGVPSFIMEISSGILMYAFNTVILRISGNNGVAAYGVVTNVYLVVLSIYAGLSQGIQPLISTSYIKKEYDKLMGIQKYSILISLGISLGLYGFLYFFSPQISEIYMSDGNFEAVVLAIRGIRLYFIGTFFVGLNLIAIIYLSITENVRQAFIISILRSVVISVISVISFGVLLGMDGVWLSFVFTEFVTLMFSFVFVKNKNSSYDI